MIQNPNALGLTTLVEKRYKIFVFKREMYQIALLYVITGPAEGVFFVGEGICRNRRSFEGSGNIGHSCILDSAGPDAYVVPIVPHNEASASFYEVTF